MSFDPVFGASKFLLSFSDSALLFYFDATFLKIGLPSGILFLAVPVL